MEAISSNEKETGVNSAHSINQSHQQKEENREKAKFLHRRMYVGTAGTGLVFVVYWNVSCRLSTRWHRMLFVHC
jgi:hypothetical protein